MVFYYFFQNFNMWDKVGIYIINKYGVIKKFDVIIVFKK